MVIDVNKFKNLLKEKSITKSELADKLGISSRTIAKIAKGENINQNVISRIVEFLNCSIDDITSSNIILETLQKEKSFKLSGGLYHQTQVKLTYNSNHIEGSKLTEDQTRFIFETKTLGDIGTNIPLDDVIETNNHFRCIDYVIDNANEQLSEDLILTLQLYLKEGTEHSKQFGSGKYKTMPNVVGGNDTTAPEDVSKEMKELLTWYNKIKTPLFEDIVEFHYRFERIHPFQDGNGRIGRLIAFKECLKNNIIPFYIDDKFKFEYYRGLKEWKNEKGYLLETCRFGQDLYKELLNFFEIEY
ncbi:MAG: Fic family protein [Clostridia bacterium]|nr:Fic family protein [Clostridia bacterium]